MTALPLRLFSPIQSPSTAHASLDQDLLAAAFGAVQHCLVVVDRQGMVLEINAAGSALAPGAVAGQRFSDAVMAEFRLAAEAALAQAFAGKTGHFECRTSADGPTLEFTARCFSQAEERYVLLDGRSIEGERKLRERAATAERQQTTELLASGLAHDLNNILTIIMGNSELLAERTAGDEEAQRLLQVSLSAARAGTDLTRLLLASASARHQQPSEICPGDCVKDWRGLIERGLGQMTALRLEVDEEPWSVWADRAQLANAVLNLTLNARDAMPDGGKLTIEVRNRETDPTGTVSGQVVMIAVSDTGAGMPRAVLDRVFEPFFSTKARGTGLGLAMVREFARQAGGSVEARSEPGKGTTIRLFLPRRQTQLGLPLAEGRPPILRSQARDRILVIEEDAALRQVLADQLTALDYDVAVAADSAAALALLQDAERVDLVVRDAARAAGANWKAERAASRLQPQSRWLLIGSGETSLHGYGLKLGATLLPKPFDRHELARKVRVALDRRR